jgi:hypothetical protein
MALHQTGKDVPETGYYQCIFCRSVILCLKGDHFPVCPAACKKPAYAFTKKHEKDATVGVMARSEK